MPVNECIPFEEPGTRPSGGYCTAAVRGKRVLSIAATPPGGYIGTENIRVKECAGATEIPVAIACHDQVINGTVPLIALDSCMQVPLTSGAAITAGQLLMADSQGRVVPFVGPVATGGSALPTFPVPVGVALETVGAADTDVAVWLNKG